MIFTFHVFWAVNLLGILVLGYIGYNTYLYKFKSKFWDILLLVAIILFVISPMKIENTDMSTYNSTMQTHKNIPPKITDNSFKQNNDRIKGIQDKDLK